MKTYLVEWDPRDGEANGFYVRMTDAQAKDLRGVFKALETQKVLREWSIDDLEDRGVSYREFVEQEVEHLLESSRKKRKDWSPSRRADQD